MLSFSTPPNSTKESNMTQQKPLTINITETLTIPKGYYLKYPDKRKPKKGEFYYNSNYKNVVEALFDSEEDTKTYYILEKVPDGYFIDTSKQVKIIGINAKGISPRGLLETYFDFTSSGPWYLIRKNQEFKPGIIYPIEKLPLLPAGEFFRFLFSDGSISQQYTSRGEKNQDEAYGLKGFILAISIPEFTKENE